MGKTGTRSLVTLGALLVPQKLGHQAFSGAQEGVMLRMLGLHVTKEKKL